MLTRLVKKRPLTFEPGDIYLLQLKFWHSSATLPPLIEEIAVRWYLHLAKKNEVPL
jgi:hypothetical protein